MFSFAWSSRKRSIVVKSAHVARRDSVLAEGVSLSKLVGRFRADRLVRTSMARGCVVNYLRLHLD